MSGSRTHPPSLLRSAERTLVDEALLPPGSKVLVACSGGPDSTALLHVLTLLRAKLRVAVAAAGVDHGLRPEAADELGLVQRVAEGLDVPFSVVRIDVRDGPNLQARARAGRLEALVQVAQVVGAAAIATGHTADDRAETLLLRLLRGAGPRGLAVLPPAAPAPSAEETLLVRPLIASRRADVLAHLRRHRLPFASDPSNQSKRFTRVRVRTEVLPILEDLSPRIVEHLCALADMIGHPDEEAPGGLGRAQLIAIRRARRLGRSPLRLRLKGGREVDVTFPGGRIVLNEVG